MVKEKLAKILTFDFLLEILILLVVFLVPTIFDRRLGIVFSGTKIAFLRAAGVIALSLWAIKIIITNKHRFIKTPLDWPILSFLLCTTVATLTSVHVYTSFAGFYGRYEGLSTWYLFGLLFFVVTNFMKSFEQLKRIIITVVSASTIMSVYSVLQRHSLDPYMWGGVVTWQRVIGTIGQPNFLAAYMLMAFFLALALFLSRPQNNQEKFDWAKQLPIISCFIAPLVIFLFMIYLLEAEDIVLWYAGFALMAAFALFFSFKWHLLHAYALDVILGTSLFLSYVCILYTQSRGGYMGLFAGAVLFALASGRKNLFAAWQKILILLFAIALISAVTMLDKEFSPLARFASEITTEDNQAVVADSSSQEQAKLELKGAAGSRGETWKSAFKIITDYPVFGVGPEVLKMVFPRYETDLFRFKEAFHVKQDRCHNETFDVAVTKGLIAFVIYLWLLWLFFKIGWQKAKGGNLFIAGLLAAGLAYLVQNQFSFGVVAITSLFWVIWAMVMAYGGKEQEKEEEKEKRNNILALRLEDIPWALAAILAVTATVLIYFSFFSFRADIFFKTGKTQLGVGQLEQAVLELDKSMAFLPFEGGTISHQAIAYLNLLSRNPSNQLYLDKALGVLNFGSHVDAYNADNYYMLAKIFVARGNLAQAKKFASIAIKIDPYYAEVYEVLGLIAEREGRLDLAAADYEKSFFINPNLEPPMRQLERLYLAQGRSDKILEVYDRAVKKYGDSLLVLDRAARAYLAKNRTADALKLANHLVWLNKQRPEGERSASPYIISGLVAQARSDKTQAFSDFQEAILMEPKNIEAHLLLGRVYIMNGNKARAKEEFEQVLMLDKNNAQAKSLLGKL